VWQAFPLANLVRLNDSLSERAVSPGGKRPFLRRDVLQVGIL